MPQSTAECLSFSCKVGFAATSVPKRLFQGHQHIIRNDQMDVLTCNAPLFNIA